MSLDDPYAQIPEAQAEKINQILSKVIDDTNFPPTLIDKLEKGEIQFSELERVYPEFIQKLRESINILEKENLIPDGFYLQNYSLFENSAKQNKGFYRNRIPDNVLKKMANTPLKDLTKLAEPYLSGHPETEILPKIPSKMHKKEDEQSLQDMHIPQTKNPEDYENDKVKEKETQNYFKQEDNKEQNNLKQEDTKEQSSSYLQGRKQFHKDPPTTTVYLPDPEEVEKKKQEMEMIEHGQPHQNSIQDHEFLRGRYDPKFQKMVQEMMQKFDASYFNPQNNYSKEIQMQHLPGYCELLNRQYNYRDRMHHFTHYPDKDPLSFDHHRDKFDLNYYQKYPPQCCAERFDYCQNHFLVDNSDFSNCCSLKFELCQMTFSDLTENDLIPICFRPPLRCQLPHTFENQKLSCECEENFPFGDPYHTGCWACNETCGQYQSCVQPGICQCNAGLKMDENGQCVFDDPITADFSPSIERTNSYNVVELTNLSLDGVMFTRTNEGKKECRKFEETEYRCPKPPSNAEVYSMYLQQESNWPGFGPLKEELPFDFIDGILWISSFLSIAGLLFYMFKLFESRLALLFIPAANPDILS